MSGTILKNILQFTGLVVGVPANVPHLLNVNNIPVIPQFIAANASGFTVTATATTLTVTRTASVVSNTVNVYVEFWHTIEDVEPPGGLAAFFPFVVSSGGASAGLPSGQTVTVANTPYNILSTDDYLFVDSSGGPITLVLPDPTSFSFVKEYFLVDSTGFFATNNITLQPNGAEMIEGVAANRTFRTAWGFWTIVTDGINWFVG